MNRIVKNNMIPKLPLSKEFLESLSLEEATALQNALFHFALGKKPEETSLDRLPEELVSRLPKHESAVIEDVAHSLAQIGDLLAALGRDLQKPGLTFARRINLEYAQLVLIRRREVLRRDWLALLDQPYPPSN